MAQSPTGLPATVCNAKVGFGFEENTVAGVDPPPSNSPSIPLTVHEELGLILVRRGTRARALQVGLCAPTQHMHVYATRDGRLHGREEGCRPSELAEIGIMTDAGDQALL